MFVPKISRRGAARALLAVTSAASAASAASGHPIIPVKLEFPLVYIQAGLELNPAAGAHPFALAPPAFWATPTTLSLAGGTVGKAGSCTHIIAPHAGEAAPAITWTYSISVGVPGGFGAAETRVRRSFTHPGGPHVDSYMAVVGAIVGTAPGAPVGPNLVIIGGSIGKHTDNPPPPGPQPIYGGAQLKVPSNVPSPGALDYPAGEMITIVDQFASRMTMLLYVVTVPGNSLNNVYIRQGFGGPILMDLRPMMQLHQYDQYNSALMIQDAPIPAAVIQAIANGIAYIHVPFSPMVHPDAQMAGQIVPVPCKTGDTNCDGVTNITDLLAVVAAWGACAMPCPPPVNCPADINGDCVVNIADLLLLIANWG